MMFNFFLFNIIQPRGCIFILSHTRQCLSRRRGFDTAPFGERIRSMLLTVGARAVASTGSDIFCGTIPGATINAGVSTGVSLTGCDVTR